MYISLWVLVPAVIIFFLVCRETGAYMKRIDQLKQVIDIRDGKICDLMAAERSELEYWRDAIETLEQELSPVEREAGDRELTLMHLATARDSLKHYRERIERNLKSLDRE